MNSIYLDYCATTPLHEEVRTAMLKALTEGFGNPSSLHRCGRAARALMDEARKQVAELAGVSPEAVVFTSGATEADGLALVGTVGAARSSSPHLITTAIEHHAVLHCAEALRDNGVSITLLPVDGQGLVDPDDLRRAIRPETVLISIMAVNNEVGSIQPLQALSAIAREAGIPFHSDAVQAVHYLPPADCFDMLSISAHKIYGPKGIGALIRRGEHPLAPLLHGGAQEQGLRPGTENVPGIAGLGVAAALAHREGPQRIEHLCEMRARLITGLQAAGPEVIIHGPGGNQCAPHILSVSYPGADAEMMLYRLDQAGIAASQGSACTSQEMARSHVLVAMGLPPEQIDGTLRLSLGSPTTREEIDLVCELLPEIAATCR